MDRVKERPAASAWRGCPERAEPAKTARVCALKCAPSCRRRGKSELQRKIYEALLVPVDDAQVATRPNKSDLVANSMRNQRCLGIVQDNAFPTIRPACPLVDLGDDGLQPE